MEIEFQDLAQHIEALAVEVGGAAALAEKLGVTRQAVYGLMAGAWPKRDVMERLGMRLVWSRKRWNHAPSH